VNVLRSEVEEVNLLRSEVKVLRAALDADQRLRYTLFRANTLADFIRKANEKKCSGRKLSASGGQPGPSFPTAQRLQRTAASITEKDLMGWGLDIKYKALLQKTDEVCTIKTCCGNVLTVFNGLGDEREKYLRPRDLGGFRYFVVIATVH